jgi:hypothetical protein
MRKPASLGLAVIIFMFSSVFLKAQDAGAQDPLAGAFPYLSPDERSKLKSDFLMALQADSSLATEWRQLLIDTGQPVGSPAETEAIKHRILNFEQKVRSAMSKNDKAIGPIIDQIDRHMPNLHPELVGK